MISDSTVLLTFKKLPLDEFWNGIKEEYPQLSEKSIKMSPLYSLHTIFVRPDILHILKLKQYIARNWMQ